MPRIACRHRDRHPFRITQSGTRRQGHRRTTRHQIARRARTTSPCQPLRMCQCDNESRIVVAIRRVDQPRQTLDLPPPARRPLTPQRAQTGHEIDAGHEGVIVEDRDNFRRRPGADLGGTVEQRSCQSGMQSDSCHVSPALGDFPRCGHGSQRAQHISASGQSALRRCVPPREAIAIGCAPTRELQCETRQIRRANLRHRIGRQGAVLVLRPAAPYLSRSLAPRAPSPLLGDGSRNPYCRKAGQPTSPIDARHPSQPRIHHGAHPGHRQTGLGHRGGQHDAPPRTRPQRDILPGGGKPAVQRNQIRIYIGQKIHGPADFGCSG